MRKIKLLKSNQYRAFEALLAGVSSEVALKLVAPREALPAKWPLAHERPNSEVPPQVRL